MFRGTLVLVAILMIGSFVALTVHRSVIPMGASGKPFDHMGDMMKCQLCKTDGASSTGGYGYHCKACGKEFRARWNDADKLIGLDW